jgi:hypothetical protein
MGDTIVNPDDARSRAASGLLTDQTARGDAARTLAAALDEAAAADFRLRHESRPVGMEGETFDDRWDRVRVLVGTHYDRTVTRAREAARAVGLTERELDEAGLRQPGSRQPGSRRH